jgi:hypothetical protein
MKSLQRWIYMIGTPSGRSLGCRVLIQGHRWSSCESGDLGLLSRFLSGWKYSISARLRTFSGLNTISTPALVIITDVFLTVCSCV